MLGSGWIGLVRHRLGGNTSALGRQLNQNNHFSAQVNVAE
jgi:hypothetical protein